MQEQETEAHATVGQAVIACQILEAVFALCVRLQFEQASAETLSEITPLESNFSKPAMRVLLDRLKKRVNVSSDFEVRLLDLINRRHKLIHRWGIEETFPETEKHFRDLMNFANALANDATAMAALLLRELIEWTNKFPELAADEGWKPSLPEPFRSLTISQPK
jgi:hypothetical protein